MRISGTKPLSHQWSLAKQSNLQSWNVNKLQPKGEYKIYYPLTSRTTVYTFLNRLGKSDSRKTSYMAHKCSLVYYFYRIGIMPFLLGDKTGTISYYAKR